MARTYLSHLVVPALFVLGFIAQPARTDTRSTAVDCTAAFLLDDGTYNFDLTPLVSRLTYVFRAKVGSYHYRYHGSQYDYLVNICDNVHVDRLHPACQDLPSAPAYQVTAPPAKVFTPTTSTSSYTPPPPPPYDPQCFPLSDPISTSIMNWTLLNETNPEDGVRLSYTGGQSCRKRNTPEIIKETNETWYDAPRIFDIELECDRELGTDSRSFLTDLINSGATISVEERSPPDECHYVMRWRSQYACPVQGTTMSSVGTWLFKLALAGFALVVVLMLLLSFSSLQKRHRQWKNGDFRSVSDLLGHVFSDMTVMFRSKKRSGGYGAKGNSHML